MPLDLMRQILVLFQVGSNYRGVVGAMLQVVNPNCLLLLLLYSDARLAQVVFHRMSEPMIEKVQSSTLV